MNTNEIQLSIDYAEKTIATDREEIGEHEQQRPPRRVAE